MESFYLRRKVNALLKSRAKLHFQINLELVPGDADPEIILKAYVKTAKVSEGWVNRTLQTDKKVLKAVIRYRLKGGQLKHLI